MNHDTVLGIGLVIILLYLVPTFVAYGRSHHNKAAIMLLNLFLGWTAIGWLAALIWSATAVAKSETAAAADDDDTSDTKTCPYCAETIKRDAKLCRYCGKSLEPGTSVNKGSQ